MKKMVASNQKGGVGKSAIICQYAQYLNSLGLKVVVVGVCNLIGVFVVKLIEEKSRKDKLWKVELTVPKENTSAIDLLDVPHSYVEAGKHTLFNFYCATQSESKTVKEIANKYGAKYFVAESKEL